MIRALSASLAALAALALAAPARADSPISGAFELKLSGYRPQIDQEPGLTSGPYANAFGDHNILMLDLEWERQFFQRFGSLAGGLSAGYGEIYGHGVFDSNGQTSSDTTALKVVPLKALLVYRFDVLARRMNVPLVPFAKAGLVYELYRVSNGSGDVASANGSSGQGARWGWEGDVGLALMLDWFDPDLAKDFDIDLGVNHSYFFAEYTSMAAERNSPFSAPSGLRLGDNFWRFGLALEY